MTVRDHFEALGLPRRYALARAELEERYREESRRWHPDRQGPVSAAERLAALQRATDLNDAYRVLRNDLRRAEHLLALRGVDLRAETGPGRVPPAPGFLMDMLELREALAEAREAKDDARVASLASEVAGRVRRDFDRVAQGFAQLETASADAKVTAGDSAQRSEAPFLDDLAQALIRLRYYERFQEETAAYEEERADAADAAAKES